MKIIKNISKAINKMPKYQQILLGIILGYIIYKIYCNVEKFTSEDQEDKKEEKEEDEKIVIPDSAPGATKFAAEAGKKAANFLKGLL